MLSSVILRKILKVGYGDLTPITIFGKVMGGICAVSGIIIIAMPVGLLANNFSLIYNIDKDKKKLISILKKSNQEPTEQLNSIETIKT